MILYLQSTEEVAAQNNVREDTSGENNNKDEDLFGDDSDLEESMFEVSISEWLETLFTFYFWLRVLRSVFLSSVSLFHIHTIFAA